uniref:Glutathione reductase n=1 Tax=Blastobotrys adeninivorans TaxID=409370 RepID=A0A060T9F0_BLAAD
MAPTDTSSHYDFLVIGGGSGGVATARRACKHGAKTLVIEGARMGGTCVNVGCVPKKVMWSAADMAHRLEHARFYGFNVPEGVEKSFDWPSFKEMRDAYVKRLNGIYERNLEKEGADYVYGWAKFKDAHSVEVALREGGTRVYTADKILIAAGGSPAVPKDIPGAEHGITSDGFFELETQPKKVVVVGAGYIAVELAGMFKALGTETHLCIRRDAVLRNFDSIISQGVTDGYEKMGIHLHKQYKPLGVEKLANGKKLFKFEDVNGPAELEVDEVLWTIGRKPLSETLNIDVPGLKTDDEGKVVVDKYQQTNVPHIFSVGDITTTDFELTPVAIAAGRKLATRLFGGPEHKELHQEFENIPTAVFSHPEAGTIGLSESQAREKFGDDKIKVYQSKFTSMYNAPFVQEAKEPTVYKIICAGPEEKVVGLHMFGRDSAEILQGFGVAVRMGATKADFDSCVAIHPTAAEELVTMT